jgi:hypothetical protein
MAKKKKAQKFDELICDACGKPIPNGREVYHTASKKTYHKKCWDKIAENPPLNLTTKAPDILPCY